MDYHPVAQLTALVAKTIDLTARLPWLYLIAAARHKAIYVGETFDTTGLASRLASHFGSFDQSTFKQRALEVLRTSRIKPPFLIVAARLPAPDDQNVRFEGSSKIVRLNLEASLHEKLGRVFS